LTSEQPDGLGVTAFVWPGRCLIEMKSRGVKLSKHYQQTFDYWLNLVPVADLPVVA
jgi:hypothetical protein